MTSDAQEDLLNPISRVVEQALNHYAPEFASTPHHYIVPYSYACPQ